MARIERGRGGGQRAGVTGWGFIFYIDLQDTQDGVGGWMLVEQGRRVGRPGLRIYVSICCAMNPGRIVLPPKLSRPYTFEIYDAHHLLWRFVREPTGKT